MTDTVAYQQRRARNREMVPVVLVRAMFFLALASVALVAFARFTERPLVGVAELPPVVAGVSVWFAEDPLQRGRYIYTDAEGNILATSADGRSGFLGAMGRTMSRQRMIEGADTLAPIQVVQRENGRIAILDTVSSFQLELMGYGTDNVAAFAQFLSTAKGDK